ncbi:MAG: carbohydrate ABC transporter permease [Armatimonadota bacterium]|nr:MAG: carbohydrate ABC transporter permease [Armatimonadota bacterium]
MKSKTAKRRVTLVIVYALLFGFGLVFALPFIWLVGTSLKADDAVFEFPPYWIPSRKERVEIDGRARGVFTLAADEQRLKVARLGETPQGVRVRVLEPAARAGEELLVTDEQLAPVRHLFFRWENYPRALKTFPFLLYTRNTLYIAVLVVIGTLLSASIVAYGFSRITWPGRNIIFILVLATMMLPDQALVLPRFIMFRHMGWIGTFKPLVVPAFFGTAFDIFLLRQFFLTLPGELSDAARIDGCSELGILWRIIMPLSKPALATVALLTFIWAWLDFMGPLVYLNDESMYTLALGLAAFLGRHGADWSGLMAAGTVVIAPIIVIFFFAQRTFIRGIALTGMKG